MNSRNASLISYSLISNVSSSSGSICITLNAMSTCSISGSGLWMRSVALASLYFRTLNSLLGIFGFGSLSMMFPLSRLTVLTSLGISKSLMMIESIPIKKGTGASSTSVMPFGRIGMSTCFQQRGNRKERRAIAAWVSNALWSDISKTFFSSSKAKNISIT